MQSSLKTAAAVAVAGFLSLAVALGLGRFSYTPILPYMAAGLDLPRGDTGLIASANFAGYLLGALIAARFGRRGSRRLWLLSALIASALSTAAMALGTTVAWFVLLRLAGGVASAVVMVFASALVLERLAAAGRPSWSALAYAGVGGGIAMSAAIAPAAAAGPDDWTVLWLAAGLLSLALLVPVAALLPDAQDRGPAAAAPRPPLETAGDRRGLRLWILAYGLFGFGYVITATFIADMMRARPEPHDVEHLVWLLVGLAAMPSVALWTWIGRRRGNGPAFAAACLLQAAGVLLSVLASDIGLLLAAAGLLGGTFMGLTALGLIEIRARSGQDPRQALALMTASFGLGQMIGPALAGELHDRLGSYTLPSLLAAAALAVAALAAVRRTDRRPRSLRMSPDPTADSAISEKRPRGTSP